jgi:hypothetical protein
MRAGKDLRLVRDYCLSLLEYFDAVNDAPF